MGDTTIRGKGGVTMNCDNCGKMIGIHLHIIPISIEGYDKVVFCGDDCAMYWARRNRVIE